MATGRNKLRQRPRRRERLSDEIQRRLERGQGLGALEQQSGNLIEDTTLMRSEFQIGGRLCGGIPASRATAGHGRDGDEALEFRRDAVAQVGGEEFAAIVAHGEAEELEFAGLGKDAGIQVPGDLGLGDGGFGGELRLIETAVAHDAV